MVEMGGCRAEVDHVDRYLQRGFEPPRDLDAAEQALHCGRSVGEQHADVHVAIRTARLPTSGGAEQVRGHDVVLVRELARESLGQGSSVHRMQDPSGLLRSCLLDHRSTRLTPLIIGSMGGAQPAARKRGHATS